MSNNLIKILIGGIILIIVATGGVLVYGNISATTTATTSGIDESALYNAIISGDSAVYGKYVNDGKALSFAFTSGAAKGETPLEVMIDSNDITSAEKVMNSGFDLSLVDNNHINTVSNLITYNRIYDNPTVNDIIVKLIGQIKGEINTPDTMGTPLIFNAIQMDNEPVVKAVLQYDTKPDATLWESETPLSYSCLVGNADLTIVQDLLTAGSDINHKGREGSTCLMDAVITGDNSLLDFLLKQPGIDLNAQNQYGQTALHLCMDYSNQYALVQLLATAGIDVTIKDDGDFTDGTPVTAQEYAVYLGMTDFADKF